MSTVPFSAFYDHLLPELKGCTTQLLDLHLLHTARDFCEHTRAWRFAFTASSMAGVDTYDISAPEQRSEIVRPLRLQIDDTLLWNPEWNDLTQTDEPKYNAANPPFSIDILNIQLVFSPDEVPGADGTDNIALIAALKPAFDSPTLPDFLKSQWLEAMRTGTLSRLMRMGSKPWADRALSVAYGSDYDKQVQFAGTVSQRGNTRSVMRTRIWGANTRLGPIRR